ncbi:MAG: acylphosphatase [Patescibacteria group bacterium]
MGAALHTIISGRVQMVMFRDFTQRKARELGLVGEVENLPDGTVRVYAEGEKEKLEKLVEHLNKGPLLAHVENVAVSFSDAVGTHKDFVILFE